MPGRIVNGLLFWPANRTRSDKLLDLLVCETSFAGRELNADKGLLTDELMNFPRRDPQCFGRILDGQKSGWLMLCLFGLFGAHLSSLKSVITAISPAQRANQIISQTKNGL